MVDISFVIPSYQSRQTIAATLDSILSQETTLNFEILVVDSSDDDTAAWIQKHYPQIQVLFSPLRLFPAAARNRGADQSCGHYLAFLDADACAEPAWLETVYAKLTSTPRIGLIGGAVAGATNHSLAGRILHWIEFSAFLSGLDAAFRPVLSSSNLLISREEFLASGGFDVKLAMAEDLLFSQKLRGKIYFENSTHVWHQHRSNWPAGSRHLRELGYWSGLYRRNHPDTGAWLRHAPLLSFGLPFLRGGRIVSRIFRSHWKEGLLALVCLPLLLVGLFVWAVGFYQGIRGSDR